MENPLSARADGSVVGDNGRQDALRQHFLLQMQRLVFFEACTDGIVVGDNGRQDALKKHFLLRMQCLVGISGPLHTR